MEDRGETLEWNGKRVFMVGVKGTGMTALAELLLARGASVSGSDVEEEFYTDRILADLGVGVHSGFGADALPADLDLVIHSAAYDRSQNPQLLEAAERDLPLLSYAEALGAFSRRLPAVAIAGVHGKTTTTAMIGTLVKQLGLAGSVLVGSGVSSFGGHSTLSQGDSFFVAETCEYRRHFLHFSPSLLLITSVEADHLDYFKSYADVRDAFVAFGNRVRSGGTVIYCADDTGAREAVEEIGKRRDDIRFIPYGQAAEGSYRTESVETGEGRTDFRVAGFDAGFTLYVPGEYNALNATAALAVIAELSAGIAAGDRTGSAPAMSAGFQLPPADRLAAGLTAFRGTARRSEVIGTVDDVLIVDDYGHHPTAIQKTLHALKRFYPNRRLVVDFMSHTYSRTSALLEDFAVSFDAADIVIINKIYASARESFSGSISGKDLADAIAKRHRRVHYAAELDEAADLAHALVQPGDLFVTLGAGNNWQVGRRLMSALERSA